MKAHADLKKLLASKNMQAFVVDLCHYVYEWSEFIPAEGLEYPKIRKQSQWQSQLQ